MPLQMYFNEPAYQYVHCICRHNVKDHTEFNLRKTQHTNLCVEMFVRIELEDLYRYLFLLIIGVINIIRILSRVYVHCCRI